MMAQIVADGYLTPNETRRPAQVDVPPSQTLSAGGHQSHPILGANPEYRQRPWCLSHSISPIQTISNITEAR